MALEAGKKIAAQWNMYSIFVDAIASLAPPIFQSVGLEVGQSVTLSDSVCVGGGPTNLIRQNFKITWDFNKSNML